MIVVHIQLFLFFEFVKNSKLKNLQRCALVPCNLCPESLEPNPCIFWFTSEAIRFILRTPFFMSINRTHLSPFSYHEITRSEILKHMVMKTVSLVASGGETGGSDASDDDRGKRKMDEVGGVDKGKSKDPDFPSTDEESTDDDDDDEKMEARRSSFSVSTLVDALPGVKRSLSMVPGKAKSFQNFAELKNAGIQDLVKKEHPFNKRRRLERQYRESPGAATHSASVPEPPPARRQKEDGKEESGKKEKENREDGK